MVLFWEHQIWLIGGLWQSTRSSYFSVYSISFNSKRTPRVDQSDAKGIKCLKWQECAYMQFNHRPIDKGRSHTTFLCLFLVSCCDSDGQIKWPRRHGRRWLEKKNYIYSGDLDLPKIPCNSVCCTWLIWQLILTQLTDQQSTEKSSWVPPAIQFPFITNFSWRKHARMTDREKAKGHQLLIGKGSKSQVPKIGKYRQWKGLGALFLVSVVII